MTRRPQSSQPTLPGVDAPAIVRLRAERIGREWAESEASRRPLAGGWPHDAIDAAPLVAVLAQGDGELLALAFAADRAARRRWGEMLDASASRHPAAP